MFGVVAILAVRHLIFGIQVAAPIDGFCPFGGVATFLTLVSTGEFLKRIYWGSIILMAVTVVMTVVFGRAFCGFICPLGALQEWVNKAGMRIGVKNNDPPRTMDEKLRLLKYLILVLIIVLTYKTGTLIFRTYDPYVALMHFGREFEEKIIGYAVLGIVLIVALFSKNLWCRYVCPLGAFYGIVSKLKVFSIRRDVKKCTNCGVCNQKCPHGIDVKNQDTVRDADCVSCLECVESCPEECLSGQVSGKTISDSRKLGGIVLAVFLGLVAVFMVLGVWESNQPVTVTTAAGTIDPAAIRGSITLAFLIQETGIPLETFQSELGLPEGTDTNLMLRDIGTVYRLKGASGGRLETEDFRFVVASVKNVPYSGKLGASSCE